MHDPKSTSLLTIENRDGTRFATLIDSDDGVVARFYRRPQQSANAYRIRDVLTHTIILDVPMHVALDAVHSHLYESV